MADPDGVGRYEPLIRRFAATLVRANDFDDAMQDGRLAVWQALESYEPGHGTRELTWVYDKVWHAIIDGQRARSGWRKNRRPFVWTLSWRLAKDDGLTLGETLVADTTDDPECRALLRVGFAEFHRTLSPADADLIDALLSGETGRDYAARIGVDESRISQRLKPLRERLNRYL